MTAKFAELYNSPLEAGIRAVVILERLFPDTADLSEMVLYDHVAVHASDIGGPDSLHALVADRKGELLIRRGLVEAGLDLMRKCHLVDKIADDNGFAWRASEEASSYVDLLECDYFDELKVCAHWIAEEVAARSKMGFKKLVAEHIGEWNENFGPPGNYDETGA